MKSLVLCYILGSTFLVNFVYSKVTLNAIKQDGLQIVTFTEGKKIEIACEAVSDKKDEKFDVVWKRDNVVIEDVDSLKGRFKISQKDNIYKLEIEHATIEDINNYTCSVEDDVREIPVFIKPLVKVPASINAVEEEKLKIHCTVYGDPVPEIFWTYSNDTKNYTSIENLNVSTSIITLEMDDKKIENSILLIHNIQMWHRGEYSCFGKPPYNHKLVNATVMVRVKDKYAAVWPFLGICAEVFVLCAIILVYEKKRNKTELEESDTDQSPDQKNTPDHNKDSNLRHRQ